MMNEELRASLAKYAHSSWSGWMQYLFTKGIFKETGEFVINADSVSRWTRQMNTEYDDLPEKEKKSDLDEADKIMRLWSE